MHEQGQEELNANVQKAFARYRESLQEERQLLLNRFKFMDIAIKVVGVGSVGTMCAIMLMMASEQEPCSSKSNRQAPRSSKRMRARAYTTTTASAACMASG
jgi:Uncharacterized protein conserved in bacteria (DUF2252)